MTFSVNGTTVITTDRLVVLRSGATASRPASPSVGQLFFDTTLSQVIVWNGSAWRTPASSGGSASIPHAWTWGSGRYGRLGTGNTTNRSSPVSVVGGFTDWVQISAGYEFTAALRANGQAWTWGKGTYGRLGNNNAFYDFSSPVSVLGGFTDWAQISAGNTHTTAIRANGQAWTWGQNNVGQLGIGSVTYTSSPVSVVGGFTNWTQISGGGNFTVALRANGQAWAWGRNNYGMLGDGTGTNRSSPVSVVGGFTDWIQISAGSDHSAGLRANGQAWAWGRNNSGQIGDGTVFTNRLSPVSVVGGFTNWIQISAGKGFTAAIRANGQAWTWGSGNYGKLGTGNTTNRSSPNSVVGGFTDWVQIAAGWENCVGIRANGQAWTWGSNYTGQLGDGTTTDRSSPVSVLGGFTDWVQIAAGASLSAHSAAIRSAPQTQTVRPSNQRNTF